MTDRMLMVLVLSVFTAAAAAAQDEPPTLSIRPFVVGTEQSFKAVHTFEAIFGQAYQPFFGGGVQVVLDGRFYGEVGASRFRKTGERAFRNNDENFRLGLPLTANITPIEVTGGYRVHFASRRRIVPYGAAGVGSYGYEETSPSSDAGENLKTRRTGFVVNGGAEIRLHRWVGVAVDAQYTHIPGILGSGGVSKAANETDLGGVAARFKVVVGR